MPRFAILVMLVSCLLLAACSGNSQTDLPASQAVAPGSELPGNLGAVPFPAGIAPARGSSGVQQISRNGADADSSGILTSSLGSASFAQANGNDMQLVAFPDDSAYAVYSLYSGAFNIETVHYQLATTVEPNAYIGVADYDKGKWRWFPIDLTVPQLDISGFNHVSPQGNIHVVLLGYDDVLVTVEAVWVNMDTPDWISQPVSSLPRMGMVHDLALVNGTPAVIAQQRQVVTDNDLLYCYASTAFPTGPADWTSTEVQAGIFDPMLALELIEQPGPRPGFAVIYSSNQLWYAYGASTQPTGSGDWNYSFIANVESEELSLASIQNNAGMVFENLSAGGGTKVEYAWAAAPLPTGTDWHLWTVADSGNPTQNYGGLSLCAVQNDLPTVVYQDYLASEFDCFSATQADITAANQTYTTLVEDPPLGGGVNALISWQGLATVVYEQFWSVPRLARATVNNPAQPEDFSGHHDLWPGGIEEVALADLGGTLGTAWRSISDQSVWFAWYDGQPGDTHGPVDWKVVQVESRATSGDLRLIALPGNLPGITYYVDADTQLYFAATAALP